jgi:hypothetical protein
MPSNNSCPYSTQHGDRRVAMERVRWSQRTGHLLGTLTIHDSERQILSLEVDISSPNMADLDRQLFAVTKGKEYGFNWPATIGPWFSDILARERQLEAPVDLATLPRPAAARIINVEGLPLPVGFPTFIFGKGGTGKSLLALYLVGKLAREGKRTLWLDWEMSEDEPQADSGTCSGNRAHRSTTRRWMRLSLKSRRLSRIALRNSGSTFS